MKKKFVGLYRALAYLLTLCMMLGMVAVQGAVSAKAATAPYLMSQNRPVFASSYNGGNTPDLAVDGDTTTRWDSQWGVDPQWIYIDLGANASITSVTLQWESAYATAFHIDVSTDELNWTTVYTTTSGAGGTENINVTATGRYIRLEGTARALAAYGYSLYEFQVYGTGGANPPPVQLGPNIALNKNAVASSVQTDNGIVAGTVDPKFAVDGDMTTRWASTEADNEWIYVDLGATHQIGRVILNWESAYGRAYDIQVSNDATTWTTVYRQLKGSGGVENIPLYVSGRYVRMLGIARGTSYGYSLLEFQVYDYVAGDPQPTYTIPPIPVPGSVSVGSGSYETNNITSPQPDNPQYKTSNVTEPLPSNKWWTSLLINQLGNGLVTLPLKDKFTKNGLSILNPGTGYSTGGAINADGNPDLYLMANNINPSNMTTKISGYGDYSANVVVSDNTTNKMQVTLVKGSPYIFTQFSDPTSPFIYSPIITRFFDDNNNAILTTDGASVTTDHIGIEVTNQEGPNNTTFVRDYGVFAPVGTVFQRVGTKVKITLGGGNTYLSVATLPASNQLNFFYQRAYAFVTDTKALYNFDQTSSNVTTNFQVTTTQMRTDLKANTLMAMLPTQWKISSTPITTLTFPSIRGTMKVCDSNTFTTVNKFYGIIPNFAEPTGAGYSRDQLETYLATLDQNLSTNYMNADPYWQGKSLQPLACAVIICDQIGDTARRDKFLGILRNILEDWYTYTNGEPNYYFFYNSDWGTILPPNSGYGVSTGMDDHHYTYGYFVFASAVLATYDKTFLANYGGMVEQLIRDYANPSRTDTMYPYLRNFDTYEGHSWAGGYGDNDSGCNEEATDECLFSWVGEYLWGIVTSNNTYRDAGIYGFTTEEYSIEQYWFNYDGDNWAPGYTHGVAGQVWGSGYLYGTYFSGDPDMIYGIQWLPTAEYTSYYGRNPAKAAALYQAFLKDNGGLETTWYDIIWPFESLGDPQGTLAKWDPTKIAADGQSNDTANSYWFICSMASAGERTMDIWSTNYSAYSVFKNGTQYTAQIWNPTNAAISVSFANAAGNLATVTVPANTTVNADPTTGKVQLSAPSDSLTGGTYTGAQSVTLGTIPGATVHYTTDGSTPTANSPTYTAPFNVTTTTTVKAIAVEAGLTNSPITSETYTITAGNTVATPTLSLAAGKYIGTQSISIACSTMGATIHYTTDGSTPTASSPTYTSALSVSSSITLNAIGVANGLANSAMVTAVYTVTPPNIALNKTATASSAVQSASLAFDGNDGTRWESAASDPQWLEVDLGSNQTVGGALLEWETASAKAYQIQVSTDNVNWTTVYSETNGAGGTETVSFAPVTARYVRMYGTVRNTQWGYSLYEFEVFGGGVTAQVATPTFTPAGGTFTSAQSVTLADSTSGAVIHYTTDGSTPTASSATYTGAIAVSATTTINAIATATSMTNSSVASATYTIAGGTNLALNKTATASSSVQAASLAFDGNTGTRWESSASDPQWLEVDLGSNQTVSSATLNWETAAAKSYSIQTSTDNTNWTTVYSETNGAGGIENVSFTPTTARYVRMYGTARTTQYGYSLWEFSIYGSGAPTQQAATPTFTPAAGTFTSAQSVTLADSTSGAVIHYTTDGSTPTASSPTYTGAIAVSATTTINAIAIATGMTNSAVATATYTINTATTTNLALNKTATASSAVQAASLAFDGNTGSRWESSASDPQWLEVDLGANCTVSGAQLNWETAAAKAYSIQVSTDNTNWTTVYSETNGVGGIENITFNAVTARYVRMYGTVRTTQYGYSLWEFQVLGTAGTTSTNLALGKTATASSVTGTNTASLAVDSDPTGTRWESAYSDPQWIEVDLGANHTITGAQLSWETAAASAYSIQVSTDNTNWTTVYSESNGVGGVEKLSFASVSARYVRMYGTARTTAYGYSLWDFEVLGS